MITEDYVSFETAKLLKEKGFDADIDLWYNSDGEIFHLYHYDYKHKATKYFDCVQCPTLQMAMKWLRKEKDIHIEPCILADADTDGKVINEYTYWSFSIQSIETGDMIYFEYEHIDDKRFNSYEQAALAGIEYVLDNLI